MGAFGSYKHIAPPERGLCVFGGSHKHIAPPERGLCVFGSYKHIAPPERGMGAFGSYKHIAPPERGMGAFGSSKHIAPPERGMGGVRVLQTYRSSGARDGGRSGPPNISLLRSGGWGRSGPTNISLPRSEKRRRVESPHSKRAQRRNFLTTTSIPSDTLRHAESRSFHFITGRPPAGKP
jgi:hypothetical protein